MKLIVRIILSLSIIFNIYFIVKKIRYSKRIDEEMKLHYYKNITYKEGYKYFLEKIKSKYPEIINAEKYYIIYRWDSTSYDFIYKDQMKVLDSMAASFGKYRFDYVFVTEMEENSSKSFLKRNYDEFKNVIMLFNMDDFISGVYNNNEILLAKPKSIKGMDLKQIHQNAKQVSLYLIMDSKGKILHTNQNHFMILKDSAFIHKLNALKPNDNVYIRN